MHQLDKWIDAQAAPALLSFSLLHAHSTVPTEADADAVDLFRRGLLPMGSAFGSSMFRSVFGFGGTVDPTHSPSFRFPMMR